MGACWGLSTAVNRAGSEGCHSDHVKDNSFYENAFHSRRRHCLETLDAYDGERCHELQPERRLNASDRHF